MHHFDLKLIVLDSNLFKNIIPYPFFPLNLLTYDIMFNIILSLSLM